MHAHSFSRRDILRTLTAGLGTGLAAAASPRAWAQAAPSGTKAQGRLVVVFLRGAYDGLSAFVPYADADYYHLRPTIAIAAPDGTIDGGGNRAQSNLGGDCTAVECQ